MPLAAAALATAIICWLIGLQLNFANIIALPLLTTITDFCGVVGEKGERIAMDLGRMPGARFFPDAKLNFA